MKKTFLWVVFAALAVLIALFCYKTSQVGGNLQYIVEAPAPVTATDANGKSTTSNSAVKTMYKSWQTQAEDMQGTNLLAQTVYGVVENAALTADTGESATARLTAVSTGAYAVRPQYLRFGRLFYDDELEKGRNIILLDEQLALALFKIGEPLERKVTIGETEYTVIGILRHTMLTGDHLDYGAYIPLVSVFDSELALDALVAEGRPIPGSGAATAFQAAGNNWSAGGNFYNLAKEAVGTTLPVRVLVCLVLFGFLLRGILWLNRRVVSACAWYRSALRDQYAVRLMPRFLGGILLFALGYGACAALAAGIMNVILAPVYSYPEWIPAVLVEYQDIHDTFFNVWRAASGMRLLRTPEITRLQFLNTYLLWFSGIEGALCALLLGGEWKKKKE